MVYQNIDKFIINRREYIKRYPIASGIQIKDFIQIFDYLPYYAYYSSFSGVHASGLYNSSPHFLKELSCHYFDGVAVLILLS